jgi:patatin-related protein
MNVYASTEDVSAPSTRGSREIRLGLVIYGGVSLAVYINGVAQEFFRAVRGRGVYKLLKHLCDADIVVDIISGTSAGGVNGILLSHAITNECEFSDTANLWREHGGIESLLRDPLKPDAKSLLDGNGYYIPHLEQALRNMPPIASLQKAAEFVSPTAELDLFVTATDFDGRQSTQSDSTGRLIDIKSHAMVFQLKHRAGRKEPFSMADPAAADTNARICALAKLSAMTSCFPGAFEPIHVAAVRDQVGDPDYWLTQWGQLNAETWFLDGGVLDNKPFSYTIQQIFERTATKPVERLLFYVDPDPEQFNPANQRPRRAEPGVVAVARGALIGIPGYESISEDLRAIVKRNEHISQRLRLDPIIWKKIHRPDNTVEQPSDANLALYRQVRFIQLSDRVIQGLMKNFGLDVPLSACRLSNQRVVDEATRQRASRLRTAFDDWDGDGDITLQRYDIYFRVRRIYQVVYAVSDDVTALNDVEAASAAEAEENARRLQQLKDLLNRLNQFLEEIVIIRWAMEEMVDSIRVDPAATGDIFSNVWADVRNRLDSLLRDDTRGGASDDSLSEKNLGNLHGELGRRLAALNDSATADAELAQGNTLLEVFDRRVQTYLEHNSIPVEYLRCWENFALIDAFIFPIDFFANVNEKDEINIVRVSPADADRGFCREPIEGRVKGEALMHFSAFLKRSWRSNDILWGRLDGSCRLFDSLLTRQAVERAMTDPKARHALRTYVRETSCRTIFSESPRVTCQRIDAWLIQLADEDAAKRYLALADSPMYDLLLESAHLEIIAEGIADVYEDATYEQLTWNGHWVDPRARKPNAFKPSYQRWDSSLFLNCAREWTNKHVERLKQNKDRGDRPLRTPLGIHFTNDYKVRLETIAASIPPAILLELLTRMLIVARNCVLTALPPAVANVVRRSLVYRLAINTPLSLAYVLANFARRERVLAVTLLAALAAYSCVALFVAAEWTEIWYTQAGGPREWPTIAFVIVPTIIFGFILRWGWLNTMGNATRPAWARGIGRLIQYGAIFAVGLWIVDAFVVSYSTIASRMADQGNRWVPALSRKTWTLLADAALVVVALIVAFGLPTAGGGTNFASRSLIRKLRTEKSARTDTAQPPGAKESGIAAVASPQVRARLQKTKAIISNPARDQRPPGA